MTSDHIRRALILLFIFNVVLMFQNWQSSSAIKGLESTIRSAVSEKSAGDVEINKTLKNILGKMGDSCPAKTEAH